MYRFVLLVGLSLLLLACRPEDILPLTPTPQNVPISEAEIASAWHFRDPLPVEKPVLVEQDDGMALDPNWRMARAEYISQWWGLGSEPELHYQVVTQGQGVYHRDGKEVSEDGIAAFLGSISRFTPIQQTIGGYAWSDDYPSYTIAVTGEDGQQLLFISNSTGNPGSGPWNLIYNDQLYAQYDGSFGKGLNGVFDFGAGREPGSTVNFSTQSAPLQLVYGFSGLLPLADSFQYQADLMSKKITGIFIGRSSIGGFGNMIIGTFTDTTAITLTLEDSSTVSCTFEPLLGFAEYDPTGAGWQFECPMVASPTEGTPYRYGITIELVNDAGKAESVSGTLTGIWTQHPTMVRLPLPHAITEGLAANADASALLERHDYAFASYNASLAATPPHTPAVIMGEIGLYGSTSVAEQLIPYQLFTLFSVQKGKAPQWGVSEASFDTLLTTALTLTPTQTLLEQYPDIQLHLGSTTNLDLSDTRGGWGSYYPIFSPTELSSCLTNLP